MSKAWFKKINKRVKKALNNLKTRKQGYSQ